MLAKPAAFVFVNVSTLRAAAFNDRPLLPLFSHCRRYFSQPVGAGLCARPATVPSFAVLFFRSTTRLPLSLPDFFLTPVGRLLVARYSHSLSDASGVSPQRRPLIANAAFLCSASACFSPHPVGATISRPLSFIRRAILPLNIAPSLISARFFLNPRRGDY